MNVKGIARATIKRKEREFFKLVDIERIKSLKDDSRWGNMWDIRHPIKERNRESPKKSKCHPAAEPAGFSLIYTTPLCDSASRWIHN